MNTTITRLVRARTSINQMRNCIKDCKLTEQSFVNATSVGQYRDRAAILWQFSAIVRILEFPSNDPIYTVHPGFFKTASQLYSVHTNSIDCKDGEYGPMTEVDYNQVWSTIMGPLEELYPTIDVLIKAEQTKEKEKNGEEGRA